MLFRATFFPFFTLCLKSLNPKGPPQSRQKSEQLIWNRLTSTAKTTKLQVWQIAFRIARPRGPTQFPSKIGTIDLKSLNLYGKDDKVTSLTYCVSNRSTPRAHPSPVKNRNNWFEIA